jgi:energy-coupling factor transporter ATP-binding protein EcfA2
MLDEPTTGLDDASTARMMAIAAALPAAVTLLATTHDHRLQTMPGAGVIALRGGRVEGDGHAHAADGTCPIDHAPLPAAPTLDAAAAPDDPGRADDGAGAGARPPAEAAR